MGHGGVSGDAPGTKLAQQTAPPIRQVLIPHDRSAPGTGMWQWQGGRGADGSCKAKPFRSFNNQVGRSAGEPEKKMRAPWTGHTYHCTLPTIDLRHCVVFGAFVSVHHQHTSRFLSFCEPEKMLSPRTTHSLELYTTETPLPYRRGRACGLPAPDYR
jgi:hypothetical protein